MQSRVIMEFDGVENLNDMGNLQLINYLYAEDHIFKRLLDYGLIIDTLGIAKYPNAEVPCVVIHLDELYEEFNPQFYYSKRDIKGINNA